MPDTIGFALATAFLATAFTVFGIIDRFVAGLAAEIRYSVAPAMVSGVRAWGRERVTDDGRVPGDDGPAAGGAADGRTVPDRHDAGLVVPVTAVPRRGWHLFALVMRNLLGARRAAGARPAA